VENETIAWLMYLAGAAGLVAFFVRITLRLRREWRYPLLASIAALLLTPARMDPEQGAWAPAVLILTLGGVFEGDAELAQAGLLLLMGWLLALLVSLGLLLIKRS
jgi:hypothetical protein